MTFSKRERYIFIATLVVISLALAYNFIIEPFFKKWNSVDAEIVKKRTVLKKSLKLLDNRNDIIKEFNNYASSIKNISKILSYVEEKAISSGIKTSNIKPNPENQKGLYKEYIIELQIEGTFSAISKFLSALIKPPAFIAVKKFEVKTAIDAPSFFKGTIVLSKLII
jgi:Tfp pilus assembly protein PilO